MRSRQGEGSSRSRARLEGRGVRKGAVGARVVPG